MRERSRDLRRYFAGKSALYVAGVRCCYHVVIGLPGLYRVIGVVGRGNEGCVELCIRPARSASAVDVVAYDSRRDARIPTQGHIVGPTHAGWNRGR